MYGDGSTELKYTGSDAVNREIKVINVVSKNCETISTEIFVIHDSINIISFLFFIYHRRIDIGQL